MARPRKTTDAIELKNQPSNRECNTEFAGFGVPTTSFANPHPKERRTLRLQ
jgi:hypothetical protein